MGNYHVNGNENSQLSQFKGQKASGVSDTTERFTGSKKGSELSRVEEYLWCYGGGRSLIRDVISNCDPNPEPQILNSKSWPLNSKPYILNSTS